MPKLQTLLLDIAAAAIIYFLPQISRLTNIPLYNYEPTRILLFTLIFLTARSNVFLMAICLPLVANIFSHHPSAIKTSLVIIELLLNAVLIYYFLDKRINKFLAAAVSILAAKTVYYFLKWLCLYKGLLSGELIATAVSIQFILLIVLAAMTQFLLMYPNRNK